MHNTYLILILLLHNEIIIICLQMIFKFRNIEDFGDELRLVACNSAILIGCLELTYKHAGTISSGVFFNFFYINMPELSVPAFFLIFLNFFLYKYAGTISSGIFFNFFLYKYAGTISSGIFLIFFYINIVFFKK